jgi:hypothetical protein
VLPTWFCTISFAASSNNTSLSPSSKSFPDSSFSSTYSGNKNASGYPFCLPINSHIFSAKFHIFTRHICHFYDSPLAAQNNVKFMIRLREIFV